MKPFLWNAQKMEEDWKRKLTSQIGVSNISYKHKQTSIKPEQRCQLISGTLI